MRAAFFACSFLCLLVSRAAAEPLTADQAVKMALARNSSVVQAEAGVLSAQGGLWSAYSGVLPRASASIDRSRSVDLPSDEFKDRQFFGSVYRERTESAESRSRSAVISGSWNLLNLGALQSWRSASSGLSAARSSRQATRNEVALLARERFYDVVKAVHLSRVASGSARLARDDERRVRALFEVGSVSKTDLLKSQVRTSQSQLDSLMADHGVVTARIRLAEFLGIAEGSLGAVDTTLVAGEGAPVPGLEALLAEARRARPDLQAAELRVRSSEQALAGARFARLPYLAANGAYAFRSEVTSSNSSRYLGFPFYSSPDTTVSTSLTTVSDPNYRVSLSLNLDLFDGFATDARIAGARARLLTDRESRDALMRNLENEVRQVLLAHQEASERETLSRRALESARENLNLVQQKYNVGSATILDLIDSQVQLQRAEGDLVSSLAAILVARASIERVRGRSE